ncbi:MAG: hypothetical protein ACP5H9_03420 [Candidatus Woesearchaeota archaeon]
MMKKRDLSDIKKGIQELVALLKIYEDLKSDFERQGMLKLSIAREEILKKALALKDNLSEIEEE